MCAVAPAPTIRLWAVGKLAIQCNRLGGTEDAQGLELADEHWIYAPLVDGDAMRSWSNLCSRLGMDLGISILASKTMQA